MIDDPPLLEIATNLRRPTPAEVRAFADTPTSFIADALGGGGALDWRIKPIGPALPFIGVALTCDCGPSDNLALCAAVAQCQAGDVLVAATSRFTGAAVCGDLLVGIAKNRGAVALVTDGLVRDQTDIEALAMPCYAMGATPNSPARNGPGSVGLPVQCGGARIASGDIIAGDHDGVVVVPFEAIGATIANLAKVREAETAMLAKVRGGLTEVRFIDALLASGRVRWRDG